MASSHELVHFDELESELDSLLREMVRDFAKRDPSVKVETGDTDSVSESFSRPFADRFMLRLRELQMGVEDTDEAQIRQHFTDVISEYETVDLAVVAKVEDQTPEIGVNALISEHRTPIMQLLQELDEGYES